LVLRDGTGFLQCVISEPLVFIPFNNSQLKINLKRVLELTRETSIEIHGSIGVPPPPNEAPGGFELKVEYLEIIGRAPIDLEELVNKESNVDQLFNQRHIVHRGKHTSDVMKLR
jgi:asparaginyl-tRNA synthetase